MRRNAATIFTRWLLALTMVALCVPAIALGDEQGIDRNPNVALDDLAGILVVDSTIDGKGPYHFVLDTGAGITVVTPALAKAIDAKAAGSTSMRGMGEKTLDTQTVVLGSVAVGQARQTQVRAAIVELPPALTYQGRYGTIAGILGASFLSHYVVTIDVAGDRASFTSERYFDPPSGAASLPLSVNGQLIPMVTASAVGTAGRFEIDSGNNGDVVIAGDFARAHEIGAGAPTSETRYQGVGGAVDTKRVRLRSLMVDGFVLHRIVAAFSQLGSGVLGTGEVDGNLGYDFIRRFVLTLDYPGWRLYLQKSPSFDSYKPVVGNGMVYDRNADGSFAVVAVTDQSPAARAGVVAHDTVVAIGGKSVEAMSDADFRAAVDVSPGTSVAYTLVRNGMSLTVTVVTIDELP